MSVPSFITDADTYTNTREKQLITIFRNSEVKLSEFLKFHRYDMHSGLCYRLIDILTLSR